MSSRNARDISSHTERTQVASCPRGPRFQDIMSHVENARSPWSGHERQGRSHGRYMATVTLTYSSGPVVVLRQLPWMLDGLVPHMSVQSLWHSKGRLVAQVVTQLRRDGSLEKAGCMVHSHGTKMAYGVTTCEWFWICLTNACLSANQTLVAVAFAVELIGEHLFWAFRISLGCQTGGSKPEPGPRRSFGFFHCKPGWCRQDAKNVIKCTKQGCRH